MICDFISIESDSGIPMWKQIYEGVAEAIGRGMIGASERLPSVRELSDSLGVSRSPVENAYIHLQLDGRIESRPKSGYFALKRSGEAVREEVREPAPKQSVKYDLCSTGIDSDTADIPVWRKHLRAALNMQEKIISAGDPQGERELRDALVRYCFEARKVKASSDRIVIASGTQQLLTELCRMAGNAGVVAAERPGYARGERIFRDFGWKVEYIGNVGEMPGVRLREGNYDLFADITSNRPRMPLSQISRRRKELLDWAEYDDSYILEDDYNGELRYFSRSVPSLQGASPERVIYIGSFSRLLLPSVRIAYMVIPGGLAERAGIKSSLYDQTSSKIEQLALANYINDGHLEKHIRRSRKAYQIKSREMLRIIGEAFEEKVRYELLETSLCVAVTFGSKSAPEELSAAAHSEGIAVDQISCSAEEGLLTANLSFSAIPCGSIRPAVQALCSAWKEHIR
ncbi:MULTISPECIES: PLP-dependent aminotransferase family protein [Synergistaceae]|uniref:aminotransferase-like domain-containing protein n=1 Tax=Synergistaceae TaxID=649777 RepID=UPI003AE585D5|nr:PLP-dependent aminotransferase family protein [Synergistaceae bacterium DZ-S4]